MYIYNLTKFVSLLLLVFLLSRIPPAFSEDHIRQLDAIRSTIITQGNSLPQLIREADDRDIRTLERIYELNTSLLTTVEAYFKMLKLVIASGIEIKKEVIDSLNEWLIFIHNQCNYDMEFLDEAMYEADTETVIQQIKTAKGNIQRLYDATEQGITENNALLPQEELEEFQGEIQE